jgi:hypothetical protein
MKLPKNLATKTLRGVEVNLQEFWTAALQWATTAVSRPALGPTQPPIQWVPEAFCGKAAGAWNWPLPSITFRGWECVELYHHSPSTISWRGAQLKRRARRQIYLTFTFTSEGSHRIEVGTLASCSKYCLGVWAFRVLSSPSICSSQDSALK